ncbi:uncharacterized protein LOC113566337 [Drosophila persimilis]|uniref:uncharacterized protein LOC113566337 n=1 Tax=Drosophila persimilis TaxID=7234 RepID=UPI000F07B062|nr:uncharacterized protein LOC113566337 [Drosophila persimilis]
MPSPAHPQLQSLSRQRPQFALAADGSFRREFLHYAGRFIFRPLKGFDTNQMEIIIKLHVSEFFKGALPEYFGNRLVNKRWLMMERDQTVAEVDSCQDEDF